MKPVSVFAESVLCVTDGSVLGILIAVQPAGVWMCVYVFVILFYNIAPNPRGKGTC